MALNLFPFLLLHGSWGFQYTVYVDIVMYSSKTPFSASISRFVFQLSSCINCPRGPPNPQSHFLYTNRFLTPRGGIVTGAVGRGGSLLLGFFAVAWLFSFSASRAPRCPPAMSRSMRVCPTVLCRLVARLYSYNPIFILPGTPMLSSRISLPARRAAQGEEGDKEELKE